MLEREYEDLWSLIDRKMLENAHGCIHLEKKLLKGSCNLLHWGWIGCTIAIFFTMTSKHPMYSFVNIPMENMNVLLQIIDVQLEL